MNRFESWAIHLSNLLVAGTGLVYAWMLYGVEPSDAYAVVNHPLQPRMQHLHILFAPLLIFAVGLIWQRHVWTHWKRGVKKGKRSGVSLVLTLVPMVVSGYLIQTAVADGWRKAWVAVHLAASALWLAGYLAHQVPRLLAWLRRLARASARGGDHLAPAVVDLQRRAGAAAQEPEHGRVRAQRAQP